MLVETGRVPRRDPVTEVTLETPAGLVACRVAVRDGRPEQATIRNVPAFSALLDATVEVPGLGRVPYDLACSGGPRGGGPSAW